MIWHNGTKSLLFQSETENKKGSLVFTLNTLNDPN
jgi:hypothetical protein